MPIEEMPTETVTDLITKKDSLEEAITSRKESIDDIKSKREENKKSLNDLKKSFKKADKNLIDLIFINFEDTDVGKVESLAQVKAVFDLSEKVEDFINLYLENQQLKVESNDLKKSNKKDSKEIDKLSSKIKKKEKKEKKLESKQYDALKEPLISSSSSKSRVKSKALANLRKQNPSKGMKV